MSDDDFPIVGRTYQVVFSDCCVYGAFEATLEAILHDGDIDPLAPDEWSREISWPSPRTYWSNGVVIDAYVDFTEVDPLDPPGWQHEWVQAKENELYDKLREPDA